MSGFLSIAVSKRSQNCGNLRMSPLNFCKSSFGNFDRLLVSLFDDIKLVFIRSTSRVSFLSIFNVFSIFVINSVSLKLIDSALPTSFSISVTSQICKIHPSTLLNAFNFCSICVFRICNHCNWLSSVLVFSAIVFASFMYRVRPPRCDFRVAFKRASFSCSAMPSVLLLGRSLTVRHYFVAASFKQLTYRPKLAVSTQTDLPRAEGSRTLQLQQLKA